MQECQLVQILGARIKNIRKRQRLSQEKLAELAGLHPTYISDIERGKVNASICAYLGIAQGLGLSLAELVTEVEKEEAEVPLLALVGQARALGKEQLQMFLDTAGAYLGLLQKTSGRFDR